MPLTSASEQTSGSTAAVPTYTPTVPLAEPPDPLNLQDRSHKGDNCYTSREHGKSMNKRLESVNRKVQSVLLIFSTSLEEKEFSCLTPLPLMKLVTKALTG